MPSPDPFIRILALFLISAEPGQVEEWRNAFDKHYGLASGEVLKRVPPPFIDERIDFLLAAHPGSEFRGLTAIVVEWGDGPRMTSSHFGTDSEGLALARIWESVLKRKPYEIDAPRELLDREFAGDWVVRVEAKPDQLLNALARIISEELEHQYRFVEQPEMREVVVVRGRMHRDVDPTEVIKLDLPVAEIQFREHFRGSAMLRQFYARLSAASGWVVIDETDQKHFFARIEYGDDQNHELAPPEVLQISKEQMEQLVEAIERQTGLEFKFEEREITHWALQRT